jgi:hypothetical protein
MSDHYQTLGVQRNATPDEIKKAYRKLAGQHHPDKEGGDKLKFQEIQKAYEVLGDDPNEVSMIILTKADSILNLMVLLVAGLTLIISLVCLDNSSTAARSQDVDHVNSLHE